MGLLDQSSYLDHLRRESARFAEVLAGCDPAARVPSCPDWDASDLLWHLTTVQHFWARRVLDRPTGPDDDVEPVRPEAYADLLRGYGEAAAALVEALDGVDVRAEAWTWHPTDHTVGFILRRQAHEALIHRLDAELAAGTPTELDPVLASDGVEEALAVMFGGCPPWGTFTPLDRHVRVDAIDTDQQVWVQLGQFTGTDPEGTSYDEPDIRVVPARDGEPDAVVAGTAADLDAWLWRRRDGADVQVVGDRGAYDRFRVAVNQPIT
jgi:uncharacterized protein (TIGR03083 family)